MTIHPSLLLQFQLLRNLTEQNVGQLASLSQIREFAKREVVLDKGEPSQFLCFLLEGKLQAVDFTLDGKEVGIYFIDEGDYFGEIAMLDGAGQPEMVIAIKKSRVVRVPAWEIRNMLFSTPTIMEAITQGLALRIRRQSQQRQLLAINNPVQRIIRQLQGLTRTDAQRQMILNAPTHQELAIMVNLTRETVTRAFQVLQAQGALLRDGDHLVVDAEKIQGLVDRSSE
jgi:CRP/FNR family transcriptional regulator, cyclic AMP receptor protein